MEKSFDGLKLEVDYCYLIVFDAEDCSFSIIDHHGRIWRKICNKLKDILPFPIEVEQYALILLLLLGKDYKRTVKGREDIVDMLDWPCQWVIVRNGGKH